MATLPPGNKPGSYASTLREVRERLRMGGIEDWESSAEWLITDALGLGRTALLSQPDEQVPDDALEKLESWVARRLDHEPVQYILGYVEFYGLRLHVDRRVLIPRPETEFLVERVVDVASKQTAPRILDVGTGSGCIALGLASRLPWAEVVAADKFEAALEVAGANAAATGLPIEIVRWDLFDPKSFPSERPFTIVVSNPPYIPADQADGLMPEVALFEPAGALFVTGDPLSYYRAILTFSDEYLDMGGYVFFEVNPHYATELQRIMTRNHGFAATVVERDLAGLDRIVWGQRVG